ncbi:hypothetical protein [Chondromyces crocatus]|uniref:DUF3291 domain-containing protein n=1 Tax=Chondromyces crocatus TaxID=52 RepID=A0A0K1EDI1_CHOCO|nr:hypothetical protein [Chondromyces crocatus]AKT38618.1 uncharacterized protein CMC5_027650 [Chondromyces crocatus]
MHRTIRHALPLVALSLGLCALTACSSSDDGQGKTTGGQPEPEPDLTGAAIFPCDDSDMIFPGAFAGPGYDPTNGGFTEPPQERYIASSTLVSIPADQMNRFFGLMTPLTNQLADQPGLIGYQLALSQSCGYGRTISVWKDEESMMAFVVTDAHIAAMSEANTVTSAGLVTSWELGADQIPVPWETVKAQTAKATISYGSVLTK